MTDFRTQLKTLGAGLLRLHKSLLELERAAYERQYHDAIASAEEMRQQVAAGPAVGPVPPATVQDAVRPATVPPLAVDPRAAAQRAARKRDCACDHRRARARPRDATRV